MSPARHVFIALLSATAVMPACSATNSPASHTGDFAGKAPIINLGTCCVAYDSTAPVHPMYTIDPKMPSLWRPVVQSDGKARPAGHADDAYFTGDRPRTPGEAVPKGYHFTLPPAQEGGRLVVNLERLYPNLSKVKFPEFEAFDDGSLTVQGQSSLLVWLNARYGGGVRVDRLGEGGFAVAYKVCLRNGTCRVAKIRKILPTFAEWKRIKLHAAAADELKRDLVMFAIGEQVTARTTWLGSDGKAAPFLIGGRLSNGPTTPPTAPDGRLARMAPPGKRKLLAEGVVDQELIAFKLSAPLLKRLAEARVAGSRDRIDAYASLSAGTRVTEADIRGFFDTFTQKRGLGPEVRRVLAFSQACTKMATVPNVASLCLAIRREVQIPDDFEDRVRALEQMYRDSAGEVIRFTRSNFDRALGNPGADKLIREIGLDYNHGRNVGWDSGTRQFVLFDC